tara:strand:- start:481 stop:612 length:132 start_codon:yes stop_codon:yes gene_type:complete
MDLVTHEVVRTLEELAGEDHDGGGAVANLAVLEVRELDENLGS